MSPSLLELILLAVWLGAAVFFGAAVAPALFAVLPERALAGAVVGRLLPVVFYAGMIVGTMIVVADFLDAPGWAWRVPRLSGAIMVVACGIAQWIVAPRIERLRADIGGSLDALPVDDVRRVAFGRLHGASVAWLGLAMLAAAVALVAASRSVSARQ